MQDGLLSSTVIDGCLVPGRPIPPRRSQGQRPPKRADREPAALTPPVTFPLSGPPLRLRAACAGGGWHRPRPRSFNLRPGDQHRRRRETARTDLPLCCSPGRQNITDARAYRPQVSLPRCCSALAAKATCGTPAKRTITRPRSSDRTKPAQPSGALSSSPNIPNRHPTGRKRPSTPQTGRPARMCRHGAPSRLRDPIFGRSVLYLTDLHATFVDGVTRRQAYG